MNLVVLSWFNYYTMKYFISVTFLVLLSFVSLGSIEWQYFESTSSNFQIMAPDSGDTCQGVNFIILDTVYDNQNPCEIRIGVTGGTLPYSFFWTGPNGYTTTVQNPQDITYQGVYTVLVTDSLGCTGSINSTVLCISIEELIFTKSIHTFPNPNHGIFTLVAENVGASNYSVVLRSMVGQLVFEETFFASGSMSKDFELQNLQSGVYLLQLTNEEGKSSTLKVLIK